jgi:hypothetical protein
MAERLFDVAPRRRTRREWGRWLPIPVPARCPRRRCTSVLVVMPAATQLALFIHGGYGAAEQTRVELCPGCGWAREAAVETVNPRHVA